MTLLVFLVEDDVAIRANLMDVMSSLLNIRFVGFAQSETAAVEWLGHHQRAWDLAVVDLFLEEGTGFGVMSNMKFLPHWQHVVALTNSATAENRAHAIECGAQMVFDKTAELAEFLNYCEQLQSAAH